MRSFVLHAFAFSLLQAAIWVVVWSACPRDPDHYMAAHIDKHARLRAATGPRLIFVGGSSVGFGIDSQAFIDGGLEFEPVNMGLNDGFGLHFMLAEVAGELRPHDVVVVAPETQLYWVGIEDDAIWAALEQRPVSAACLSFRDGRALGDQGLLFVARKLRCAIHQDSTQDLLASVYRRSNFDARGDFIGHRKLARRQESPFDQAWPEPDELDFDEALGDLRRFARRCEQIGARCFLAWSPIREAEFERHYELFSELEARVHEIGMPMLERPVELAFAEHDFFDRGPHLTGEAAFRRSTRLADRLAAALAR